MYLKILPALQAHGGIEIHHMLDVIEYEVKQLWLTSNDDIYKLDAVPDKLWAPFGLGRSNYLGKEPPPEQQGFAPFGAMVLECTRVHPDAKGNYGIGIWIEDGFVFVMNDKGDTIEKLAPPAWPPESDN